MSLIQFVQNLISNIQYPHRVTLLAVLLSISSISLVACSPKETVLSGRTMGTTYSVKIVAGFFKSTGGIQQQIDQRLEQINQSMSTYRKDSEISRFNRLETVAEPFSISADFYRVMTVGRQLFELSDGAWDATVSPLVNLWGFGPEQRTGSVPGRHQIAAALKSVGFEQIDIGDRQLVKARPQVTLDLGSIAKGYGVDQIADLLRNRGFEHFLVEIGGEVYAEGLRKDGGPWRVGINRPLEDAPSDAVYKVVALSDLAMATSGDYRNFFEIDRKRYSHVIDPRTGYPVANGVISATVLAGNCTLADGLATALMVMGAEKGVQVVNGLRDTECLIIISQSDGTLVEFKSDGFGVFVDKP